MRRLRWMLTPIPQLLRLAMSRQVGEMLSLGRSLGAALLPEAFRFLLELILCFRRSSSRKAVAILTRYLLQERRESRRSCPQLLPSPDMAYSHYRAWWTAIPLLRLSLTRYN